MDRQRGQAIREIRLTGEQRRAREQRWVLAWPLAGQLLDEHDRTWPGYRAPGDQRDYWQLVLAGVITELMSSSCGPQPGPWQGVGPLEVTRMLARPSGATVCFGAAPAVVDRDVWALGEVSCLQSYRDRKVGRIEPSRWRAWRRGAWRVAAGLVLRSLEDDPACPGGPGPVGDWYAGVPRDWRWSVGPWPGPPGLGVPALGWVRGALADLEFACRNSDADAAWVIGPVVVGASRHLLGAAPGPGRELLGDDIDDALLCWDRVRLERAVARALARLREYPVHPDAV